LQVRADGDYLPELRGDARRDDRHGAGRRYDIRRIREHRPPTLGSECEFRRGVEVEVVETVLADTARNVRVHGQLHPIEHAALST
jgi:hypothetical protein